MTEKEILECAPDLAPRCTLHPAWPAFIKALAAYQYGGDAIINAWTWFQKGSTATTPGPRHVSGNPGAAVGSFVHVTDIPQMPELEFCTFLTQILFLPAGLSGLSKYNIYQLSRCAIFDRLDATKET